MKKYRGSNIQTKLPSPVDCLSCQKVRHCVDPNTLFFHNRTGKSTLSILLRSGRNKVDLLFGVYREVTESSAHGRKAVLLSFCS